MTYSKNFENKFYISLIGIVKTARRNLTKLSQIIGLYVLKIFQVVIYQKELHIFSFPEISENFLWFFVTKIHTQKISFKIYVFYGNYQYENEKKYEF